jgi:1-acyl-sn-glycerol-3-phosphate acyltransferase
MVEHYQPRWAVRALRPSVRALFRGIFHILSRVEIQGLENVPSGGAYLIAINHVSLFEAPFVVSFWPVAPEVAGAADVWNRPGQSILAKVYGGIPIHRGHFDRRMIDTTLSVLRSGYPLLIAPEGGRSHTPGMQRAKPGVAYLMDKAAVPVVPVGIVGSTDDFLERALRGQRPHIQMHVGPGLHLSPVMGKGKDRREIRQQNADRVMAAIAALLPKNYQGVYANEGNQV